MNTGDGAGLTVRVLLIEDNRADAELFSLMLSGEESTFLLTHAIRLEDGLRLLRRDSFDIIVLDLNLPDSRGAVTLDAIRAQNPSTPIIILTGLADRQLGLESVRKGAQDYLVKGEFDEDLLARSIWYSIERQKMLVRLEDTLKELRVLKGLLPICSSCKRIRDDKGYWTQLEAYISEHSEAEFTHGLCPECVVKFIDEYERTKDQLIKGENDLGPG